ncbi:MAG: MarR family winged helix-turn-helix transcriptional regulator [Planctomycetota bacterium]|nr:MarR family winged helix-turn-helix transcriptional regulator [Planctomycetota bacterium]
MQTPDQPYLDLTLSLGHSWIRLERILDSNLSNVRGISFGEYRILRTLAVAPGKKLSRVDLAAAVALSPSGVTRALLPLEKIKVVQTERSERDARLALAVLTPAGSKMVKDSSRVVEDVVRSLVGGSGTGKPTVASLLKALA